MSGSGTPLDAGYLRSFGAVALPALDRYYLHQTGHLTTWVVDLQTADDYIAEQKKWRAWSFRAWRLVQVLDKRGPLVLPPPQQPTQPSQPSVPDR
jgi:hypothetical protein